MEDTATYGLISLLPVLIVIVMALVTRRTLESLIVGSMIGYVILDGKKFFTSWLDSLQTVVGDSAWYIVVFGIFGIIITLLEKSGGAQGISALGAKYANTRNKALLITWILGILIFIDDYLNNLGVSAAMRNVTDKFNVSRELLAYLINSTGAAVCVVIPISSWGVFMTGQYDSLGVSANGTAIGAYIASIPFMFYAWITIFLAPLVAFKIIPLFGPMKKAELRAGEGDVFPQSYHDNPINKTEQLEEIPEEKARAFNFIIPMLIFIIITIASGGDILLGGAVTVIVCGIMFIPQKLMSITKFCDDAFKGFTSMSFVTCLVLTSFILGAANDRLGLTTYIINNVEPLLSAHWLPLITFVLVSFLAFACGSFWGIIAIVAPIIIPLALAADCNVYIIGAAMISGTTFASHTCFYADAVTLISAGTQIQNIDYARTSIPIAIIPFILSCILYAIFGYVMA